MTSELPGFYWHYHTRGDTGENTEAVAFFGKKISKCYCPGLLAPVGTCPVPCSVISNAKTIIDQFDSSDFHSSKMQVKYALMSKGHCPLINGTKQVNVTQAKDIEDDEKVQYIPKGFTSNNHEILPACTKNGKLPPIERINPP